MSSLHSAPDSLLCLSPRATTGGSNECEKSPTDRSKSASTNWILRYDPLSTAEREDAIRQLLQEIYHSPPSSLRDVSDTLTDTSVQSDNSEPKQRIFTPTMLRKMDVRLLREEVESLSVEIEFVNRKLVRALRQRGHQVDRHSAKCSFITAVLQAHSPKRSVDARMKFSMEPAESGREEWKAAMRAVARLPSGVPPYFRTKLWTTLADQHMKEAGLDWEEIRTSTLSDRLQSDDGEIHSQIIKDLHRTGWAGFTDENKLKQVLLAFARYNKEVGYCQGFNVIAALILQVVDFDVGDALKVMIFLIDQLLPRGYFDQSLRALSIDMAVLRELMQQRLPNTVQHLEMLQSNSGDYEPPLTNVFSMHWLLTLFATCLPRDCVFRIWDGVMLNGSEVLLRTAIAIWARLGRRIVKTRNADEFYGLMEALSKQLTEMNVEEQDHLITVIYSMSPFPYPGLAEARDKFTWNIQPMSTTFQLFQKSVADILHDRGATDDANSRQTKKTDLQLLQKQYGLLRKRQQQAAVILTSAYHHGQNVLLSAGRQKQVVSESPTATIGHAFNHLQVSPSLEKAPCVTGGSVAVSQKAVQPTSLRIPGKSPINSRTPSPRQKSDNDSSDTGEESEMQAKGLSVKKQAMRKSKAMLEMMRPSVKTHEPVMPVTHYRR